MHTEDLLLVAIMKWAANMFSKGIWSIITFTAVSLHERGLVRNRLACKFQSDIAKMHTAPSSTGSLPTTKNNNRS